MRGPSLWLLWGEHTGMGRGCVRNRLGWEEAKCRVRFSEWGWTILGTSLCMKQRGREEKGRMWSERIRLGRIGTLSTHLSQISPLGWGRNAATELGVAGFYTGIILQKSGDSSVPGFKPQNNELQQSWDGVRAFSLPPVFSWYSHWPTFWNKSNSHRHKERRARS